LLIPSIDTHYHREAFQMLIRHSEYQLKIYEKKPKEDRKWYKWANYYFEVLFNKHLLQELFFIVLLPLKKHYAGIN
jgi:hypothetical protein